VKVVAAIVVRLVKSKIAHCTKMITTADEYKRIRQ